MPQRKIETSNKQVQTIIHCFPHILLTDNQAVTVFADRSCQTAVTTPPETININFYVLLEFTPYQAIAEGCLREVDLPRKPLLQWNLPTVPEDDLTSNSSTKIEKDKQKRVTKKSIPRVKNVSLNRFHTSITMQKSVVSQEVQTTLTVLPHVLDVDEVANVYTEHSIQTSITCLPSESISNILPQLKANLSHVSGYTETPSTLMNRPPEIKPADVQPESEEVVESIQEPPEDAETATTDDAETEAPEDSESQLLDDTEKPAEEDEQPPEQPGEGPPEQSEEDAQGELTEQSIQVDTLSVTISSSEVKSQRVCKCRTKVLDRMASRLQVQTSTLKLTPIAFPPNLPFADRMVEVLNTIIAVLQTEMANLMEVYMEEEKTPCGCTDKSTDIEDIKNDPRSCKCKNTEAATNTDNSQTALANDPRSCKCGAKTMPPKPSTTIAQGSQKEIKKISSIRQVINPNTMQPDTIREDIVEETIRTVTVSDKNETIIEEKSVTKTTREKLPDTAAIEPSPKKCKCSEQSGVKDTKPPAETEIPPQHASETQLEEEIVPEASPIPHEEPAPEAEPEEPITEAEPQLEEEEVVPETVPIPDDEPIAEAESVPVEDDATDAAEITDDEAPEELAPETEIGPQPEIVGDGAQIKRLSYIPCECHPTETGAAVPILTDPGPSTQSQPALDSNCDQTTCDDQPQSTTTDIPATDACSCDLAKASSNIGDLTDEAPSLAEDAPSTENTIKFKILLKKQGMKVVESQSAASALVIRANISCPDTSKDGKPKVTSRKSLPDLREQVIRLRVIYKSGPTEPETQIEELLSPSRPVTIAPNKSPSSHVNKTSSKISAKFSIKTQSFTSGGINEPDGLVCAKGPPELPNVPSKKVSYYKPPAATAAPCDSCTPQRSSRPSYGQQRYSNLPFDTRPPPTTSSCDYTSQRSSRPSYGQRYNNLPLEVEQVPSMACPVHPKPKASSCVPACTASSSAPASPKPPPIPPPKAVPPPPKSAKQTAIELTIAISTDGVGTEQHEEDTSSFMYEHDPAYDEPYMEELIEPEGTTTACQTDLTLGDQLESESLNSLGEAEYKEATQVCASNTEMPWHKISLPPPGTYSIQPVGEPTHQVAVMTDEEPKETEQVTEDDEEQESGVVEEASEVGEEESTVAEEEEVVIDEQGGGEEQPRSQERKEALLFESDAYTRNEPYMDSLYRAFPDSDEGICGSQTEIPWKDIILPENCRIKKAPQQKKCTCKPAQGKLSGMFLPSRNPPRNLIDNEDSIVALHIGFDEQPSTLMQLSQGGAATQSTPSFVSTVSNLAQKPKRVEKNFTLLLNLAKESVSYQGASSSLPFSVSTAFGANSSAVINIKPSTECKFPSQRMPVPSGNERLLQVVNPTMHGVTETRSCTQTNASRTPNKLRSTSSMPQVPSQKSLKATISLKRLGQPDQVVTQTMDLSSGPNQMTMKVPDTPISVNLQMSSPGANAKGAPSSSCQGPCANTADEEPTELFSPARCPCKDKVKLDTFRQNPVMAALEAYEAEMKPLRLALTELQQKIRNLNLPEMKGCMCATALENPTPKVCGPCSPCPVAQVAGGSQNPAVSFGARQNPPGTCPYYQAASFRPPPPPPYGRLPPPVLPPRFDRYAAAPANYTPPNAGGGRQQSCRCGGNDSHHSNKRHGHRSNRQSGRSYPREDLAVEARSYGMYPDYRGRTYSNDRVAYEDSFIKESTSGRGASPDKYRTSYVVSIHSSGNVMSDHGSYDSQGASDGEDSYHRAGCNRKSSRRRSNKSKIPSKYSSKSCTPRSDTFDSNLRDGQAVKTSPEEFLCCPSPSSRRNSQNVTSVVSKTKLKIKFPRY